MNIVILEPGKEERVLALDMSEKRLLKIGTSSSAQVCVEDLSVSSVHGVLRVESGVLRYMDMGSKAGSTVNGVLARDVVLEDGDEIGVGSVRIQIRAQAKAQEGVLEEKPVLVQSEKKVFFSEELLKKTYPSLADVPVTRENRVLEIRVYTNSALLYVHHFKSVSKILLGETEGSDIFISCDGLPAAPFPLIRRMGNDMVLSFASMMTGEVDHAGVTHTLEQLRVSGALADGSLAGAYNVVLEPDSKAVVHWGGASLAVRFVAPAPKIVKKRLEDIDPVFANAFFLMVFLYAVVSLWIALYPHEVTSLQLDVSREPDRFASLILKEQKPTEKTRKTLDKMQQQRPEQKTSEKTVQRTVPDKPSSNMERSDLGKKAAKVQKQAEISRKIASMLSGGQSGGLLSGSAGGSASGSLRNVIGTAGNQGLKAGVAGLNIRADGAVLGGGGLGTSRGIGGVGTSGRSGGGGLGYGAGVDIGRKADRNLVALEAPEVVGALPAEAIKKVINDNRAQIRYCYEIELQHQQHLEGRVAMKWVISGTGEVSAVFVKESTLHNKNVESCLARKIKGWKFPAPAGGGVVEVNYPFVFKSS